MMSSRRSRINEKTLPQTLCCEVETVTTQNFYNHKAVHADHKPDEDIYQGGTVDPDTDTDGNRTEGNVHRYGSRNAWGYAHVPQRFVSVTNEELEALRNDTGNHAFVFESGRTVIPKEVTDEDI